MSEPMRARADVGFTATDPAGTEHQHLTTLVLETDDGLSGTGLLNFSVGDRLAVAVVERLAGTLLGRDPFQIRHLREELGVAAAASDASDWAARATLYALEAALWDLLAKSHGMPLYRLLGGKKGSGSVPVYAGGGSLCFDSIVALAEEAAQLRSAGFQRMKVKIGHGPAEDEEIIARIREAVGRNVELMVDANKSYDFESARAFCPVLAKHGITWFEEPLVYDMPSHYRELRELGLVRIAGGELYHELASALHGLDSGMFDVMQTDVGGIGLSSQVALAEACRAYGVGFTGHCFNSAMTFALSLHVHLAIPNAAPQEYDTTDNPLVHSIFSEPFRLVEGQCILPDKPGLGFDLDRRAADACTTREAVFR
jgi:D-galactarolactone cycloisomerase